MKMVQDILVSRFRPQKTKLRCIFERFNAVRLRTGGAGTPTTPSDLRGSFPRCSPCRRHVKVDAGASWISNSARFPGVKDFHSPEYAAISMLLHAIFIVVSTHLISIQSQVR
jgi:hypothetical protein